MKEVLLYVLMAYNAGHSEAVWTYGPVMTLPQCEALKAATLAEVKNTSWSESAVVKPKILKCVNVPGFAE